MITHRLRGLVHLHIVFTGFAALLAFLAYAQLVRFLPYVEINEGLSLLPYLLCIGLGMALSGRFVHRMAPSFHRLTWTHAAWLTTRQLLMVAMILFAFMFAFKDRAMSRLFVGTYLGLAWGVLLVINAGFPRVMSSLLFGQTRQMPTIFVGGVAALSRLKNWMGAKAALGLKPVGFISTDGSGKREEAELPFLGELKDLPRALVERRALQVVMLELPKSDAAGRFVIEACQQQGCRLLIQSDLAERCGHPLASVEEEGNHFFTLQSEPLEDPFNRVLKRALDVAVSLPVVLFILPVLFVWVWLMQRIQSPGPVIFSQLRSGYGQQPFRLLKFRSMRTKNPDEARQARKGDERVYPFGQFLRRSSLDEFPQFWNVLVGDMSLVGPRPHMLQHDAEFAEALRVYRTRFLVKPGITGLAQCRGFRGEITDPLLLRRRVECDINYINNWSIWLDMKLVVQTVWQIFSPPRTAY